MRFHFVYYDSYINITKFRIGEFYSSIILSSDNKFVVFLPNFFFNWSNIPSCATKVEALLVANGDLPLNSLLPKLRCLFSTFPSSPRGSSLVNGFFLLPPQSPFLGCSLGSSSPPSSSAGGSFAGSLPSVSICSSLNLSLASCTIPWKSSFFSSSEKSNWNDSNHFP